jgi:LytS/YehU family sensor histidine kinase
VYGSPGAPYGGSASGWFIGSLPFGVAVYFAVLGAERAAAYFVEARERETQAARLTAQLAEARLGALRMQLRPHFLFNSLNAITVVVRDQDTRTATRMLEQLGEVLHQVMRADRPQEVSLAEELDFLRRILELEQIRFSDRLHPEFDLDPALLGAAVPDFILQPLVENALRHGLAARTAATLLRIEARREGEQLVLTVTDDGPGPSEVAAERREGVGLANTRERLATLYGGAASLTLEATAGGGARATIRIPWRPLDAARPADRA